ncbi:hypothetical protein [Eilatimonas milleporae]|uniref:Uncharacterized protein n=1 Tax=Eilatimonas milleporae TaxID=911205 RepID=A0A3M0CQ70_9PROT|nr:hypothetical protein [Eilatimonas milleporae]RMB09019.1 hypothetical protein BXY39_1666 [Eilatimonas milleporae]
MTVLSNKTMLVGLHIHQWSARKHDPHVSDQITHEHDATRDAGRFNKLLISHQALGPLKSIISGARNAHTRQTLPWYDNGMRILPAQNYLHYMEIMSGSRMRFQDAVNTFISDYAKNKVEAKKSLGTLYQETDYPQEASLRRRFGFEVTVMPIPKGDDFRVNLQEEEVSRIQSKIEIRIAEAQHKAMADLWNRIHESVSHMHERLTAYGEDPDSGRKTGMFRDTLVTNLRDLTDLLPRLNFMNDPQLEDMCQQLKSTLCAHDANDLREDGALRRQTADKAQDILDEMSGYVTQEAA